MSNIYSSTAWGPKSSVCDSCHQTELLLNTVEFSDGALFHVCGGCAEVSHRLGLEVLA
jgi:hypothetical protein